MLSAFFVLGFTTVFVALGASASAVGGFLLQHKTIFEYVAGAVIIVFGVYLTGLIRIPFFEREARFAGRLAGGKPASAFLLGAAFAFGWTPCIGPVLGGILTLTATSADVGLGVGLLAVYSLGLGVPFLIAAAFTGFLPPPHEAHPQDQQATADRRRSHSGGHGGSPDHRLPQLLCLLAARSLPRPRGDRVIGNTGRPA